MPSPEAHDSARLIYQNCLDRNWTSALNRSIRMTKQAERRRPRRPSLLVILLVGILAALVTPSFADDPKPDPSGIATRSEEHTSELQSLRHLVCRLLLE